MAKHTTISEIGKALGISHSTVSRALNDSPRVNKETKKKIKELASELGYYSNYRVHQLNKGSSKIIGVIVPDLSIHFFSCIVDVIQNELITIDYSILLFNTSESLEKERVAVSNCLKHRVDGVLAAISMETNTFDHFEEILNLEIPLIFFDRVATFFPVPKIVANDYEASYKATEYLIKTGCKRIAHITGSKNLNNSNNRLYGYLDALNDNEIEVEESLIHYYQFHSSSIEKFLKNTLEKFPDLDGMFVFNDYCANYSINVLSNLGKKVPIDVSVIGFSDEPVATYMSPQLSTVQQIAPKMGKLAVKKMIAILTKDERLEGEKVSIDLDLIIRQTTKRQ